MKKNVIYMVGAIIVILIVAGLLLFVLSGDNTSPNESINVQGTWRVVANVNNDVATIVESEYMVFTENQAFVYRDENEEPYASSEFTIDTSLSMNLPDVSREYIVDMKSQNHMRLYENANSYMCLIRYPSKDMNNVEVDTSLISGRWNIVYRDTDTDYSQEYLVFENGKMYDYHGEGKEPSATLEYTWDENKIVISTINKIMTLHIISDTEVIFIENDTGYIWELEK